VVRVVTMEEDGGREAEESEEEDSREEDSFSHPLACWRALWTNKKSKGPLFTQSGKKNGPPKYMCVCASPRRY
jgi:hypothetical protein